MTRAEMIYAIEDLQKAVRELQQKIARLSERPTRGKGK